MRKYNIFYLFSVIEHGKKYLKADQFIKLTKWSVTPIRELAMKALGYISENNFMVNLNDLTEL